MISQLTLTNFRGFRNLELQGLKRVNLVVGPNNSGKTSLLEAVQLLSEPSQISHLPGLLRAVQGNADLRFFRWLLRDGAEQDSGDVTCMVGPHRHTILLRKRNYTPTDRIVMQQTHQLVHAGQSLHIWRPLDSGAIRCRVVSVQHRNPTDLVKLVGTALRRSVGEDMIQRILATADPRIRKLRVDPGEDGNQVIVDIGLSELIPVSQAGQGIYRLVTILADLIGEAPDVVLIDEIENGLHHSIHKQVWTGLAETAEQLNVQIIATTNSDECLRAAHDAFSGREEYDLSVIQLFRVESGLQGRVLQRELIEDGINASIDLR